MDFGFKTCLGVTGFRVYRGGELSSRPAHAARARVLPGFCGVGSLIIELLLAPQGLGFRDFEAWDLVFRNLSY